jgi:GT2 family glycosyltransferase
LNFASFHAFPLNVPSAKNMACGLHVIRQLNFFDPRYNHGMEDMDFMLKALRRHKVKICKDMVVVHANKRYDIERKVLWARRSQSLVVLIKDHSKDLDRIHSSAKYRRARQGKFNFQQCYQRVGPIKIAKPFNLAGILFFPIVLIILKEKNVKLLHAKGIRYACMVYAYFIVSRLIIWVCALKERVFVV